MIDAGSAAMLTVGALGARRHGNDGFRCCLTTWPQPQSQYRSRLSSGRPAACHPRPAGGSYCRRFRRRLSALHLRP